MEYFGKLVALAKKSELWLTGKSFLLSIIVGVVAGLGAILFQFLMQSVTYVALGQVAGWTPGETRGEHARLHAAPREFSPGGLLLVMVAGGLLSGAIVYRFAPEAEGHGTDAAIDAFHNKRGFIRARVPIVKTIASALTIGTGGSGGREGPIAQIGAGFGSLLATRLELSARERRILMAAGMGAGVGAIFRAPLAGALFAGEILYRDADIESDVIIPTAVSSIVAYSVYCFSLPQDKWFSPLFGDQLHYTVGSPLELLFFGAMSLVLVLAGIVYIKTFYGTHRLFAKFPVPKFLRPAIGAGLAGAIGLAMYYGFAQDTRALAVLATGYGALQESLDLDGSIAPKLLIAIALVKILTTSLTISSGGSGGVFGPSMVIGGCVGAAVGQTFHSFWPDLVTQPQAYAIVGMAGFFSAVAHAPFSTIVMVSEMTGDYKLLLPTMWVSTICFLLGRRWSLYIKQVPTRLESKAHFGDFLVDLLEGIRVQEVYRPRGDLVLVPEGMPLQQIVRLLSNTRQQYFPVVTDEGKMVGIFSADDVRTYLYDQTIWQLANARDIMVSQVVSVTPEDDLNTALKRFTARNIDELPVIDSHDSGKLLGMLRRKDTIALYNRRLVEHKQLAAE